MNRVTQRGPVAYALLASLVAHACALAWLVTRPESIELPLPDNALSVVLQQAEPPSVQEPVQEPEPPEPDVAQRPEPTSEPEQVPDPVPSVVAVETVVALEKPASIPDSPAAASVPKLDLSRPKDWDALATESPETLTSFGFKKSNRQAIVKRQEERARTRVLTRAQIARLGLPADAYRQRTDEGEEVKTSKGCFVKRVENGPNGQSERWWVTKCRDSKVPEWRREVLTFGPDHRVTTGTPADPETSVEP